MVGNVSRFGGKEAKGEQCDSVLVLGQSGKKGEFFNTLKIRFGSMRVKGTFKKCLLVLWHSYMVFLDHTFKKTYNQTF